MPLVEEAEQRGPPARQTRWRGLAALLLLVVLLLLGGVIAAVFSAHGLFLGHTWVAGEVDKHPGGNARGFSHQTFSDVDLNYAGRAFKGPFTVQLYRLNLGWVEGTIGCADLSKCRPVPSQTSQPP